jgi:putative addiction module killer protein
MEIKQTEIFESWYNNLKDIEAVAAIRKRLDKIERESYFGDHKRTKGGKVWELRIHIGKGYRVYYALRDKGVLLLCGGHKDTQKKDTARAKLILKNLGG